LVNEVFDLLHHGDRVTALVAIWAFPLEPLILRFPEHVMNQDASGAQHHHNQLHHVTPEFNYSEITGAIAAHNELVEDLR
jgi:hypothetical protein